MTELNYPYFDSSKECGGVFQVTDVDITEYDEEYQNIREDQIRQMVPPEFRINVVRNFIPMELGDNHLFYSRFAWRYYPSLNHRNIKCYFQNVWGARMLHLGLAVKSLSLKKLNYAIDHRYVAVGGIPILKVNANTALCLMWERAPGALLGYVMHEKNKDKKDVRPVVNESFFR